MRCPYCGAEISEESVLCPECHLSVEDGLPMNWFRFLKGAGLWLAGACTLILGILTMLGVPYVLQGFAPGVIYDNFKPLVVMDFVYGVVLIALAVLCIITRFRLAAFQKKGPVMLYIVYALIILCSVVYSAASSWVISGGTARLIGLTELSSIAGMIAGVILNVIYFNRRKHLFIN